MDQADCANICAVEDDVTIFVHGYNSTQTETIFRAAQLTHDIGIARLDAGLFLAQPRDRVTDMPTIWTVCCSPVTVWSRPSVS